MEKHRKSMLETEQTSLTDKMFGVLSAGRADNEVEVVATVVRNLMAAGCFERNIKIRRVPMTDDIPMGVQFFAEYTDVDAVIVLSHDGQLPDYVKNAVIQLQMQWNMPVVLASDMNTYWKIHTAAIDMISLQVAMEAESTDTTKPDRRTIN